MHYLFVSLDKLMKREHTPDKLTSWPFPPALPLPGVRALGQRGGERHHQAGEEDTHHHLQTCTAARVSGEVARRGVQYHLIMDDAVSNIT